MDTPASKFDGNLPALDVNQITLEEPDYEQMKDERTHRTRQAMKAVDASLTSRVLPQETVSQSTEDTAAIKIQKHYRGYLGRKEYASRLFLQFEEEERQRQEKMLQQVEEGQLLVDNHKLEVLLEDDQTLRRNRDRQYICKVLTIQRAWRAHLERRAKVNTTDTSGKSVSGGPGARDALEKRSGWQAAEHDGEESEDSETESAAGGQTMTLSTPEENQELCAGVVSAETQSKEGSGDSPEKYLSAKQPVFKTLQDTSESESIVSDYSELGGPLKELEKEIEFVDREDLQKDNFPLPDLPHISGEVSLERQPGESEADHSKRLRKLNFLSLAQEFAELKKINADACPIDFHLNQGYARTASSASLVKRNSLSEADQSLDSTDSTDMETPTTPTNPERGRDLARTPKGDRTVVLRGSDEVRRRSSSGRSREGSAKRNSHHGTPTREPRPPLERPLSQPVDGDFEVFTMESSMPAMNWELLEQQLQLAAEEERNRREARQTDREEIRRKLAMGTDEEYYAGERTFKKPSLSTRLQSGMNLQLCFMNDAVASAEDTDAATPTVSMEAETTSVTAGTTMTGTTTVTGSSQSHYELSSAASSGLPGPQSRSGQAEGSQSSKGSKNRPKSDPGLLASQLSLPPSDESILERQQRLQQEAKVALAQASNMARMQLEVEKQTKKKSPIADIVGVPELGDGRRVKISRKLLQEMNLAQLQVLVNDLHSQIESLNEELVHLLIERDDLHMEQDSMLVDIEDLTSFAQHMSETNNNKATLNRNNAPPFSNKRLK